MTTTIWTRLLSMQLRPTHRRRVYLFSSIAGCEGQARNNTQLQQQQEQEEHQQQQQQQQRSQHQQQGATTTILNKVLGRRKSYFPPLTN